MRKKDEVMGPSCLTKAEDNEMVFVLLGRDAASAYAVRQWCKERIRLGLNKATDPKILEARACADVMEAEALPVPPAASVDDVKVTGTATIGEDFKVSGTAGVDPNDKGWVK